MANGSGGWSIMWVRWGLAVLTLIAGSFVTLGYRSITAKLDSQNTAITAKLTEQSVKIDRLSEKIENLEEAVNSTTLGDSLQGRDISRLESKLKEHIERHRP